MHLRCVKNWARKALSFRTLAEHTDAAALSTGLRESPEQRTAASSPIAGGQIEAQCKWCQPCVSSQLTAWWSPWTRSRGACTPGAAKHVMRRPQQPFGLSAHMSLSFWEDRLEHSHACIRFPLRMLQLAAVMKHARHDIAKRQVLYPQEPADAFRGEHKIGLR